MFLKGLIRFILFSNIFYGICAVALCIETSFQQQIPILHPLFYVIIFCITIIYYTYAYVNENNEPSMNANERSIWYFEKRKILPFTQTFLLAIFLLAIGLLLYQKIIDFTLIDLKTWLLLLVFPFLAVLYYGNSFTGKGFYSLRKFGLFKPFLIGLIWAGTVSIIPIFFYELTHQSNYVFQPTTLFLVVKNWLYISVLCILFDLKDYATDHNVQLKTFIVRLGLRKTLFSVVLPMAVGSWSIFLSLSLAKHFPPARILFNSIPFILLIIVSYSMYQRKSILYYLAIIDGLMLVKAVFGITSMLFTK